jgi:hypothetical protein
MLRFKKEKRLLGGGAGNKNSRRLLVDYTFLELQRALALTI